MHFPESVTGAISEFCFCGFRVLIYDGAGGANPKSWDGCNKALAQFDVSATAAKPQTWSLLWCRRQTWKMNGCGGLRLSLAHDAQLWAEKLDQRDGGGGDGKLFSSRPTQISTETR